MVKIGLITDSVGHLSFDSATCAGLLLRSRVETLRQVEYQGGATFGA